MIDIIPAIDLIGGKCVRLSQGDYSSQKTYCDDPLDMAKEFEAHGIRRLHLVDLDGAQSHHVVNYKVLERIATHTSLTIDFGGGIKSDNDLIISFESGAQMVTIGSIAVTQPELFESWLQRFGPHRIILGADARNERIATHGWMQESTLELLPFLAQYTDKGVSQVLCTDISRDGMLQGPNLSLYTKILAQCPDLYLIASGGVSSAADIHALNEARVPAVVVGKALYEKRITLSQLTDLIDTLGRGEN